MFIDRVDAGKKLALALIDLCDQPRPIVVLAIPRGGVIVAREVARVLDAPLDVCLTHKLGAPDNPELAIGAAAEDGTTLLDQSLIEQLSVTPRYLELEIERQRKEMARRAEVYRRGRERLPVANRIVIVIDDGIATGSTLIAALRSMRGAGAGSLIAAAPVGPAAVVQRLQHEADRVVCLRAPIDFWAVGSHYQHFNQVSDSEVVEALSAES